MQLTTIGTIAAVVAALPVVVDGVKLAAHGSVKASRWSRRKMQEHRARRALSVEELRGLEALQGVHQEDAERVA